MERVSFLFYEGTSPLSLAIRAVSRGSVSHAAFVVEGVQYEAWSGGVRAIDPSQDGHTPGTRVYQYDVPATFYVACLLRDWARKRVGQPYDYLAILGFLPLVRLFFKNGLATNGKTICSEYALGAAHKIGLFKHVSGVVSPRDLKMMFDANGFKHTTYVTR